MGLSPRQRWRFSCALLAMSGLVTGAGYLGCQLTRWAHEHFNPLHDLLTEQRKLAENDIRLAESVRRLERTDQVIWDVIAERLTLRQAASRFQQIAEEYPGFRWEKF